MTDVWRLPAIGKWEKSQGKHPTQKPLSLLSPIILASTDEGDWVLDPFAGSSTTGIAACLTGRRFAGIEIEEKFCQMSAGRRDEMRDRAVRDNWTNHIPDLKLLKSEICPDFMLRETTETNYGSLPF